MSEDKTFTIGLIVAGVLSIASITWMAIERFPPLREAPHSVGIVVAALSSGIVYCCYQTAKLFVKLAALILKKKKK